MSKQKGLQQLDLFQGFIHEPKTEKQEIEKQSLDTIVFENEKIAVKLKAKEVIDTLAEPVKPIQLEEKIAEPIVQHFPTLKQKPKISTTKLQTTHKSKRGRKSFKEMDEEVELINVPSDDILKQKLYYPIREVASFFKVNTSLIRAWEIEFDILKPRKNRKGDRLFRFEDIKNLQVIYYLLRNKKFSIDGAKKYLKENRGRVDTNQQVVQSLTRFKNFLTELKNSL